MPRTTKWSEVRGRRQVDEAAVMAEKLRLRLAVMREACGVSQAELAERLGTSQPSISQFERGENQQLNSLAKYIHALGGQLEIRAVFGDSSYRMLDDLPEAAAANVREMLA